MSSASEPFENLSFGSVQTNLVGRGKRLAQRVEETRERLHLDVFLIRNCEPANREDLVMKSHRLLAAEVKLLWLPNPPRMRSILIPWIVSLALLSGCARGRDEVPRPSAVATPPAVSIAFLTIPSAEDPSPEVPTSPPLSNLQLQLLEGARSTLGDMYDDAYYAGGPPPQGRGACTDVVYSTYRKAGVDLQQEIEKDSGEYWDTSDWFGELFGWLSFTLGNS
jgi:uncharacterized protein DUF1287